MRRPHVLDLHRPVPVGRRRDLCRGRCRSRPGWPRSPKRSRARWPMLISPRTRPISVAAALPTCELCAHTTALAPGPRACSTRSSVSNMWRVALVPGIGVAVIHCPVIDLGRRDEPGIALRVEIGVPVLGDIVASGGSAGRAASPAPAPRSGGCPPAARRGRRRPDPSARASGSRSVRAPPAPPPGSTFSR